MQVDAGLKFFVWLIIMVVGLIVAFVVGSSGVLGIGAAFSLVFRPL